MTVPITKIITGGPPQAGLAAGVEKFLDVFLCLDQRLPVGESISAKIFFDTNAFTDPDLQRFLRSALWLQNGIEASLKTGKGESTDFTREKVFNKKLEIGGSLTNKIGDKGKRQTETAFDLRFAPFQTGERSARGDWSYTLTPLLIEGSVSNKKISADTLSTNAVHIWFDSTFFKLTPRLIGLVGDQGLSDKPQGWNLHRIVLDGGITADRDFKENEYGSRFSYWWSPGVFNRFIFGPQLANRQRKVLFDLLPLGFDLARKQVRRPMPFSPSEHFVRRLRFGTKLAFQIPPFANVSFEDTFYVRGETPGHRQRNYFKGQVEYFPFAPTANFSQGFFVSFERGTQPPFATPNISTWKVGFRARVNEW